MPNSNYNKIVYGGRTLIDLTADTISADKLLKDFTAHDKSGATITGTCTYDSDTQDATAAVAEILLGKTAYARGSKITGTMPNNGKANGVIATVSGKYTIPQGYHDGSGGVTIDSDEQAKIIPTNIRQGITILGVEGTMTGTEDVKAEAKEVTPTVAQQTVLPGDGFNYISQVVVKAIPYVESENSAGGLTVTIA
jgi:hypothetical protein